MHDYEGIFSLLQALEIMPKGTQAEEIGTIDHHTVVEEELFCKWHCFICVYFSFQAFKLLQVDMHEQLQTVYIHIYIKHSIQ